MIEDILGYLLRDGRARQKATGRVRERVMLCFKYIPYSSRCGVMESDLPNSFMIENSASTRIRTKCLLAAGGRVQSIGKSRRRRSLEWHVYRQSLMLGREYLLQT